MAAKSINLLPTGFGGNKIQSKNVQLARNISYASIFVLFIAISAGFGLQFFFSQNLTSVNNEQATLKSNISNLEETEYRLILTKDRLLKIDQILDQRTTEKVYNRQKIIVDNLPLSIKLEALEIDKKSSLLKISALNSRDLVRFMATLLVLQDINTIKLESMTFDAARGYLVELEIT